MPFYVQSMSSKLSLNLVLVVLLFIATPSFAAGIAHLAAKTANPPASNVNVTDHFALADDYLRQQWYTHALWHILKAAAVAENTDRLAVTQKNTYYLLDKFGDSNFSIEAKLPDLIVVDSKNPLINKQAIYYYNRAVAGMHVCCSGTIASDFNKVIEFLPNWYAGYAGLATYHIQHKNYRSAKQLLRQAEQLALAFPLDLNNSFIERSRADLELINFNLNLLELYDQAVIGYTLQELAEIKQAIATEQAKLQDFDNILVIAAGYLRRDPTSPALYEAFGDIYALAKQRQYRELAARYYRLSLQLDGDVPRLTSKLINVL